MAILRAPGGSGAPAPVRKKPPPPTGAVIRRLTSPPAPRPVASPPVRSSPAPKPPPVVVPNNTGNYSRPKPPPEPKPGPIQGGGGGNRGNNNSRPKGGHVNRPVPTPTNTPVAPAAPAAPAPAIPEPVIPGLDEYLGTDTDYQGTIGNYNNLYSNFQAGQLNTRNQNAQSFAQRLRQLQESQKLDEADLQEDFGARGLGTSGVYADALSALQKQYLESQTGLESEQAAGEASLAEQLATFQAEQNAAIQAAREAAIARRAAQYGL